MYKQEVFPIPIYRHAIQLNNAIYTRVARNELTIVIVTK